MEKLSYLALKPEDNFVTLVLTLSLSDSFADLTHDSPFTLRDASQELTGIGKVLKYKP